MIRLRRTRLWGEIRRRRRRALALLRPPYEEEDVVDWRLGIELRAMTHAGAEGAETPFPIADAPEVPE